MSAELNWSHSQEITVPIPLHNWSGTVTFDHIEWRQSNQTIDCWWQVLYSSETLLRIWSEFVASQFVPSLNFSEDDEESEVEELSKAMQETLSLQYPAPYGMPSIAPFQSIMAPAPRLGFSSSSFLCSMVSLPLEWVLCRQDDMGSAGLLDRLECQLVLAVTAHLDLGDF